MSVLLLGPMLRHVSETSATLWVETTGPATVEVLGQESPTFHVRGHHYALVVVEGLRPGSETPYEVHVDGQRCWPDPASGLPPSTIRTLDPDGPVRLLFGSCRAAARHQDPDADSETSGGAHGVDALHAHGLRMIAQPSSTWPHLLMHLGDQIYADEFSAGTEARVSGRTHRDPDLPDGAVADFEEYTWLYHETWSPPVVRWVCSVVPSVMIFDDHDMIDDWNISASWVRDIRATSWGTEHLVSGLMSYWIYQHLGNLAPEQIRAEGLLDALMGDADGYDRLRDWALRYEASTPLPGGYRFGYHRDLGRVRLVVVDCRNGRVLTPGARAMLDEADWDWLVECCGAEVDHLLVATTLPLFLPRSLHDLEMWNERVCDGVWGERAARIGERVRRALDLEDWSSFSRSYHDLVGLLADVGGRRRDGHRPPATISVLSGDIHLSYRARALFPPSWGVESRVHQLVSSPIRNALGVRERAVMRFSGTRTARLLAGLLRRSARVPEPEVPWSIESGPFFRNDMAQLTLHGRQAWLQMEQITSGEERANPLRDRVEIEL
jgi:hypothetical protein